MIGVVALAVFGVVVAFVSAWTYFADRSQPPTPRKERTVRGPGSRGGV